MNDRDSLMVARTGKHLRITSPGYPVDLRCRESDDFIPRILTIYNIEVVEVASGGPHDENARLVHADSILVNYPGFNDWITVLLSYRVALSPRRGRCGLGQPN